MFEKESKQSNHGCTSVDLNLICRAVGTCLQVGARSKVGERGGAKRRNVKQKALFRRNFGKILVKVGAVASLTPPVPTALIFNECLA